MYQHLVNISANLDIGVHKISDPIARFFDRYGIPFVIVLGVVVFSFTFAGFMYSNGTHQHVNCFQIFYRRWFSSDDTCNSTSFIQDWLYIWLVFGCFIGGLTGAAFGAVGLDILTRHYHQYRSDVRRAVARKEKIK